MGTVSSGFILASLLGALAAVGCGPASRDFTDASVAGSTSGAERGGTPASSGGATNTGGGGSTSAGGGTESDNAAGETNGDGDGGSGVGVGGTTSGAGGGAGATSTAGAGGTTADECDAFSCCIAGKAFDADQVSPLNACEVCKPAQSSTSWTVVDGKVCATEQDSVVLPQAATYKKENCAQLCNGTVQPLTGEVTLSLKFGGTGQNRTSNESFVELDFANLSPSDGLSVTKAVLELHAKPDAPTADQRAVTIKRKNAFDNLCSITLPPTATVAVLKCDITGAVQSWLASPAASERIIKVSISGVADANATLLTPAFADGTQRPKLVLSYSSKCKGNVCPPLLF